MNNFIATLEKKLMPLAKKIASEKHLKAIRDTFMTILPPIFFGGIIAVINSAPAVEGTTNGFMLAWAKFASDNAAILGWLNTVTMSFLSLYVCIGITYYLSKAYEKESFLPIIISVAGFSMLAIDPVELSYGNVLAQMTYFDGKGILVAILVAIMTVELYRVLTDHNVGKIKLPDSVPPALTVSFGSLVPCLIILAVDALLFIIARNATGTSFAAMIIQILSPATAATDNIFVAMLVGFLLNFGWFFGIHDTVWSGFLSPSSHGCRRSTSCCLHSIFLVLLRYHRWFGQLSCLRYPLFAFKEQGNQHCR